MHLRNRPSTKAMIGSGILAGVAGTVVMTAFQKLIEMPTTQREESYAPADFAERVLPVHPTSARGRRGLNYMTHFALGAMWGSAYGVAASSGLRGQKAVNSVFAVVYTGDVILNTALGLYKPGQWTAKDWAIDLLDKYVQAQATGQIFDHVLDPAEMS
jgi:hypothetical protein